MLCALTVRRLNAGGFDDFRRACVVESRGTDGTFAVVEQDG